MSEQQVEAAMSIILAAGEARVKCKEALEAVNASDAALADTKMKEAQKKIAEAHGVQTDAIQAETRGEKSEYSLLFTHAQDTLMTIYSEINLIKQLIAVITNLQNRLDVLEQKSEGGLV